MRLLVINGVNLNMLGIREQDIYGTRSYKELCHFIKKCSKEENVKVKLYFSNYEGDIVTTIQKAKNRYDGIIINPGAYSHYSIAILDALKAVDIPAIEVHLSDVEKREEFRETLITAQACFKVIKGKGFEGYKIAIQEMKKRLG